MTDPTSRRHVDEAVTRRIDSEKKYHESFYKGRDIPLRVNFDLATAVKRRLHNLTWTYYDTILDHFHRDLAGKRFLVAGCGVGDTALNLAKNGARVDAFDLSEVNLIRFGGRVNYVGLRSFSSSHSVQ